ncbi:maltase A1 [Diabrotica virgifera virgifera]|uniref:alpha-glucosidase n=1 Tax=Diabrotica virgifera virgifera TaxID=50390 RepID=A0A6P7F8E8_DIAVI|nr:maltase A1 [Diabrotica virgifera virgifera]
MWKLTIFFYLWICCLQSSKAYHLSTDDEWWKTATFYQIYPKSFKDSDGNGIGDLQGVIEKLDYIKDLGVTGVWLSPIFKSPQADNGYDISDYRDIDPQFGTLEIFLELLKEAHKRGIKVVLDYVPNHTSDQHEWFKKSENGEKPYDEYYIWKDGKNGSKTEPPNNWLSVFGHSGWTWSEKRQQFYYHAFLKEQPDLDYRNPLVRQEMKDVLSFWLDTHNVDGVRMDAVSKLVEDAAFLDEPKSNAPGVADFMYDYLTHTYTENQPEGYDVVYEWRSHLESISKKKESSRICMAEDGANFTLTLPYYGTLNGSVLGAHFPFNFFFLPLNTTSNGGQIANIINEWLIRLPKIYTLNWVLGNHDLHRIASRVGKEKVDALNMLTAVLPGIQITYNGEEIGMEDGEVTCEQGDDLKSNCTLYPSVSRDFERTPFQWDSSEFAGFTNGTSTWLPVSSKKDNCNVADQLKDDRSHLSIYKSLQKLRKTLNSRSEIEVNAQGNDKNVLEVARFNKVNGSNTDLVEFICNLGNTAADVSLLENNNVGYKVLISSKNSKRKPGDIVDNKSLVLDPYEALILGEA